MKTYYSQTHSLVNLANTLLAHYHAPTHHAGMTKKEMLIDVMVING
jgi:hypothetical protein